MANKGTKGIDPRHEADRIKLAILNLHKGRRGAAYWRDVADLGQALEKGALQVEVVSAAMKKLGAAKMDKNDRADILKAAAMLQSDAALHITVQVQPSPPSVVNGSLTEIKSILAER